MWIGKGLLILFLRPANFIRTELPPRPLQITQVAFYQLQFKVAEFFGDGHLVHMGVEPPFIGGIKSIKVGGGMGANFFQRGLRATGLAVRNVFFQKRLRLPFGDMVKVAVVR